MFSQEQELAEVAALQYYVEYGRDMSKVRLMDLVGSYIPDVYLEAPKAPEKWVHQIEDAYKRVSLYNIFVEGKTYLYHFDFLICEICMGLRK